ncbi:MAG: DNA-binding protein [Verrucomicrobiaceae bacterium]|nr:MAG: DNA-binding protein [Verrucomicrobiaceae bacterium]
MENTQETNRLLKPAEVAEKIGTTRNTVWRYCRNRQLPHIRLNSRNFRIRQRDLDAFLDARCR